MQELVDFLKARLDEDKAMARAAQGDGLFNGTGIVVMHTHGGGSRSVTLPSHVAGFVARWDPERVLAEVEAKRRILDRLWNDSEGILRPDIASGAARPVLELLALPYAEHPDYRPEWRP